MDREGRPSEPSSSGLPKKPTMNNNQDNQSTQSGLSNRPEQFSPDTTQLPETPHSDAFGPVIYTYSRKQALVDGVQVDVSTSAREAGIRIPTFITRGVFDAHVTVPAGVEGQDEAGRLWDIVWMLRCAILRSLGDQTRLRFLLFVRNDNRRARPVQLVADCGALDFDDPAPAITIMLPDED